MLATTLPVKPPPLLPKTSVLLLGLTDEAIADFTRCSVVNGNAQTFNFVQFRAGRLHELHDPLVRSLFVARARASYFHAFVARPPVSSFTRLRHRHQHQPGPLRNRALPHGLPARAPDDNQKIDVDAVVWRIVCDTSRRRKTLVATRHGDPLLLRSPLRTLSCSSCRGSAQEPCVGVPQHGHLPKDRRGSQQTCHTSSVFSIRASPPKRDNALIYGGPLPIHCSCGVTTPAERRSSASSWMTSRRPSSRTLCAFSTFIFWPSGVGLSHQTSPPSPLTTSRPSPSLHRHSRKDSNLATVMSDNISRPLTIWSVFLH